MSVVSKRILTLMLVLVMCAAIMPFSAFAVKDHAPLTEQKILSSTNPADSDSDITVGDWTDVFGKEHDDALRFWVIKKEGYENTESVEYDIKNLSYTALKGSIVASKESQAKSSMCVNIYLDGRLAFTSQTITSKTPAEEFILNIDDASKLKIECTTETRYAGYCIVDAQLCVSPHDEEPPQLREYRKYYSVIGENASINLENAMIYNEKGQLIEAYSDGNLFTADINLQYFEDIQYRKGTFYFEYDENGMLAKRTFIDENDDNREEELYFKYKSDLGKDSNVYCTYTSETEKGKYVLKNVFVELLNEDAEIEINLPKAKLTVPSPQVIVYRYGVEPDKTTLYPLEKSIIPGNKNFIIDDMMKNIEITGNEGGINLITRVFEYDKDNTLVRSLQKYVVTDMVEIKSYTTEDGEPVETDSILYQWFEEDSPDLISCEQTVTKYDSLGMLEKENVRYGYYYGESELEDETEYSIDYSYERYTDRVLRFKEYHYPSNPDFIKRYIEEFVYEY